MHTVLFAAAQMHTLKEQLEVEILTEFKLFCKVISSLSHRLVCHVFKLNVKFSIKINIS